VDRDRQPPDAPVAFDHPVRFQPRVAVALVELSIWRPAAAVGPQNKTGPCSLDIQVADVERILLDKLAARLDLIAHQSAEDLFRLFL